MRRLGFTMLLALAACDGGTQRLGWTFDPGPDASSLPGDTFVPWAGGPAYYRQAMDRLRSRIGGLRFYLFSDDPAWCHENLAGTDAEVCALPEANGDPLHDLHLMSRARHHIIANSSYSWWAAWLGLKPGQQVLMPDVWFRSGMVAPIEEKRMPGWETVETGSRPHLQA